MSASFIYQFYMESVMSIFRYITIIVGNDEVSNTQLNLNLVEEYQIFFNFRKLERFQRDINGIWIILMTLFVI